MKGKLYPKLLLLYACFCILSFATVSTVTMSLTRKYETKKVADSLYQDANRIAAGPLIQSYMKSRSSLEDVYSLFLSAAAYQNSTLWLMDKDGNILFSTSKPLSSTGEIEPLPGFDPSQLADSYYQVGDFFGYFPHQVLSVLAPITLNYDIKGYIAIHCYLFKIDRECNTVLNISYITLAIILLLSLSLVAGFHFWVYRPLSRLTLAARFYASGDLDYEFCPDSKGDFSHLGTSLQYMAETLRRGKEDQRKFISNISHDFRSPLTSIKGYLEAILDGTIPKDLQDRYLHIVVAETERLNKLTKELLTLNTFDEKGYFMEMQNFDINQVIKKTAETFEVACIAKAIRFSIIFDEPSLMVYADMTKIQQVLYNLIDNAIKFSRSNSTIIIETNQKHEKVFVSIKDTGIGIPQDSIHRIWDRFYKTDLSRGKDKKGTGLGLAITKEIIQAHGENINVVSTEGVGSTFTFSLQKSKN